MSDDLIEEAIVLPALPGRELLLRRPRDAEAHLDLEAFARVEYMPYWAELWPSAHALADAVAGRALHGARVVELGCGLGLPAIAAALAGGRVLATDWAGEALEVAAENAALNDVRVDTLVSDWTAPDELVARGPFDLVIGSDLLYETRNVEPLLALLPRLLSDRGEAWIADPGRGPLEAFLAGAAEAGMTVRSIPAPTAGERAHVHRLRRAAG
ncbi:MAG TPA: methyltransferase domain-containing protein [Capillimicrobium sp.]